MVFQPKRRPVVVSSELLQDIAHDTGDTIEVDPDTGRASLKTKAGVYIAWADAEVSDR